jgi:hypothetical protein
MKRVNARGQRQIDTFAREFFLQVINPLTNLSPSARSSISFNHDGIFRIFVACDNKP